jgi:hypothetical protein
VFRDSRGVVHTVSSPDPLQDLPAAAAGVLTDALLGPVGGDLGGALERCEAVMALLERWQDAFFAALPVDVDLEEEARWAAEAGLSLDEIEAQWEDDEDDDEWDEPTPDQPGLEAIDLTELTPLEDEPKELLDLRAAEPALPLEEVLVAELERSLLLLPMRVRLEALVAAGTLVASWSDVLADHEKCLGHLVLQHGTAPAAAPHEALVDQHAALHAGDPHHTRSSPCP